MILLDFKTVRGGRSDQSFSVEPDDPLLGGSFGRLTGPLEVPVQILEQPHQNYLVTLRVLGEVEAPCRRCLSPVRQPIDERATHLYEVVPTRASGRPTEEDPEESEVLPLRSPFDRVDIGPAVREALFLAAETFPLCRADCRGLCPECGEDLNRTECRCTPRDAEPRWRPLQKLRV